MSDTDISTSMPERIWVENHGASRMWDGDGEVLVSGPPSKTNCDVAEYVMADAHAAVVADRDRLAAEVARLTEALDALKTLIVSANAAEIAAHAARREGEA